MYLIRRDEGNSQGSNLLRRQYYECDRYGNCRRTPWGSWGRWVALVVILVAFAIFFIACAFISARRRRQRGLHPFWGTSWAGQKSKPNQDFTSTYDPNASTYQPNDMPPAPPYSPRANDDYYAPPPGSPPQQYEMQSPYASQNPSSPPPPNLTPYNNDANAYYPPPSSPPPAHLQGSTNKI
ncbi:hypothetical protein BDZ91DRAFT_852537 [Kalaharituber pfeilii]|nr:hypothetical protein BDZ91DRAFT_852537 [Kalaharituber pfeilii]